MKNKNWFLRNLDLFICLYFGAALSHFGNIQYYDWEFYAITLPVVMGFAIYHEANK